jgi:hypothetical protein
MSLSIGDRVARGWRSSHNNLVGPAAVYGRHCPKPNGAGTEPSDEHVIDDLALEILCEGRSERFGGDEPIN